MSDAGDSSLKRSLDHDFDGDLPSESHKRSRHSENDSATDVHQNDNDTSSVAGDDEAGGRRRYGDDIASSSGGSGGGGSGGNRRMHTNIQGAEGVLDQPGTAIDLNVFVGEIRLLVHNNDVGAIIGKQGATMRRIRDESGCLALHIEGKSKPERGNERKAADDDSQNRIMYVRGNAASIARAVGMSWQMIAETAKNSAMEIAATTGGATATNASTTGELPDVTVNLLVHRGYSGLLLGRQGATIKAMMNETGTKLKLESDCLRHSTEKRLAITGSFQRLSDAVLRIVTMIFRSTVRPGTLSIPYSPDTPFFSYDEKRGVPIVAPPPASAGAAPFYPYAPPVPAPPPHEMPYGYPPSYPPPSAYAPNPPHPSAYAYPPAAPYGPSSPHTQPHSHSGGGNSPSQRRSRSPTSHYSRNANSASNNRSSSSGAPEVVQKVAIPSVCAGLVIGKSGANIKVIRDQSRCTVKLEDTNPSNPSERIVTITGTKDDIQLAIQLITEQVEKYKPPQ